MKLVKRNKKKEGEDMAHNVNLDKLREDLDDLATDILTPPKQLDVVDLLQDRLEIHKKLRSIINNYLNFKFMN